MDKAPETVDSKFMKNMKAKFNTTEKDKVKVEQQTMENILGDIIQVPEKLHMTGPVGKDSVKPKKEGENQLHTGIGKDMFAETMKKEGK